MSVTYFRNFKKNSYSVEPGRWLRAEHRQNALAEVPLEGPVIEQAENAEDRPAHDKQGVFGYVFHTGSQTLTVAVPGDVVPFAFSGHTVLSGLSHDDGSPDITVLEPGIYEISYAITIKAAKAAYAALSLQADGQVVEGSRTARMITDQESVYSASVLTELNADTVIRLVMSSVAAVSAELSGSAVSAWMMIKMLDGPVITG